MLWASVLISFLVGLGGSRYLKKSSDWWAEIHKPGPTPPDAALVLIWVGSHLLFGAGVGLTLGETFTWLIAILAGLTLLSGFLWLVMLFGRRSVRNAFTMVSVAWVPAALTTMATLVRNATAGALTGALAVVLTAGAVWAFVLWQINEPTVYR